MGVAKSLAGQRFASLKVLSRAGSDQHGKALWRCRCDCRALTVATTAQLTGGRKKSCGCGRTVEGRPDLDLTGQRFGRLEAVEFAGVNSHGQALWECACDCGNVKVVLAHSLKEGRTRSCGCIRKGLG